MASFESTDLQNYMKKFNIKKCNDLVDLNLSNLNLTQLGSLERFKNLNRLWLYGNRLRDLPFIRKSFVLAELYLQNNLIKSIEGALRHLTNIQVLYLDANELFQLETTAKELSFLKNLRELSLLQNPISHEKNYKKKIIQTCSRLEILDYKSLDYATKQKFLSNPSKKEFK